MCARSAALLLKIRTGHGNRNKKRKRQSIPLPAIDHSNYLSLRLIGLITRDSTFFIIADKVCAHFLPRIEL